MDWFGHEEQEKLFQIGIEDIIKPLKTYMKKKVKDAKSKSRDPESQRMSVQIDSLFKNYDKDGD